MVSKNWCQHASGDVRFDYEMRQRRHSSSATRRCKQSFAIVCFEATARMQEECLAAIHKSPGFRSLHQGFVTQQIIRRLRCAMRRDVRRARDVLAVNYTDATRHQA